MRYYIFIFRKIRFNLLVSIYYVTSDVAKITVQFVKQNILILEKKKKQQQQSTTHWLNSKFSKYLRSNL